MKKNLVPIGLILLVASVLLTLRPDIVGFEINIPFNGLFFFLGLILLVAGVALD